MVNRIALPVLHNSMRTRPCLHDGYIGANRVVAWRVGERLRHDRRCAHIVGNLVSAPQALLPCGADPNHRGIGETVRTRLPAQLARPLPVGDRKSTRLNSSHMSISY